MTPSSVVRAVALIVLLGLTSAPATALEFGRQLPLRVDGPAKGQAFAFRRGDHCVALSAFHVVKGPNGQVSMADGLGARVDGEISVSLEGIDIALVRILRGGTAPCPEPPDPAAVGAALRTPVGLVLAVSPADTLDRIAVTVDSAEPGLLRLRPIHAKDAAYAGISGALVIFDHLPVGVVLKAENGQILAVPLDAIAREAPDTFSASFGPKLKYDVSKLPPEIRAVALQARQNRQRAEESAEQATIQADRAVKTAARVDQGSEAGLASFTTEDGSSRYRGEVKLKGNGFQANGYGVKELISPDLFGLVIEGITINGRFSGPGRIRYSANTSEEFGASRLYVGQIEDHRRSGFGVLTGADDQKWFGLWKNNTSDGPTTLVFSRGTRIEVVFVKGQLNGLGVQWDSEGRLTACGYWVDGKYSRPVQGCPGFTATR